MSVYGRAISILRQVEVILGEQLSEVDLRVLREATADGALTGGDTDAADRATGAWRTVLSAVGPPLVAFGREMARVDAYVKQRTGALRFMQRVVWVLEMTLVLLGLVGLFSVLRGDSADWAGLATSVGTIVILLMLLIVVFGSWNASSINEMYRKLQYQAQSPVRTALDRYGHALSDAFIVVLVSAVVGGQNVPAVLERFDASYASEGRVSSCGASEVFVPDCMWAGIDKCASNVFTVASLGGYIRGYCREKLLDICDALIELKELGVDRYDQGALWRGVRAGVDTVRSLVLLEMDDEGDARVLTREVVLEVIDTAVLPVLRLAGVELKGAFSSVAPATVSAPAPGGAPGGGGAETAGNGWKTLAFEGGPSGAAGVDTRGQVRCFQSCMASDACAVARYVDGRCMASDTYGVLEGLTNTNDHGDTVFVARPGSSGTSGTSGSAPKALMLCRDGKGVPSATSIDLTPMFDAQGRPRHNQQQAAGGASGGDAGADGEADADAEPAVPAAAPAPTVPVQSRPGLEGPGAACVATTDRDLYDYAVGAGAAATTMADFSSDLALRLLRILRRYRFAIDLDELRPFIDRGLEEHYGVEAYASGVSAAVDRVLRRTKALVRDARAGLATPGRGGGLAGGRGDELLIARERLLEKVRAMSSIDVAEVQDGLGRLRDAATAHRDVYPAYRVESTRRVAGLVSVLGSLALLVGFVVVLVVMVDLFRKGVAAAAALGHASNTSSGRLDKEGMIQRIVFGLCVFVVSIVVVEAVSAKAVARLAHNQNTSDDNGEMLVAATIRAADQFDRLCVDLGILPNASSAAGAAAGGAHRPDLDASAAALLGDFKTLLAKYDACNSITSGRLLSPPPYAELVIYGLVGATFLVLAAVVVYRISPSDRIESIRSLNGLRTRVVRGDVSAVQEAMHALECSRPPSEVWSIFAWFAIVLLVAVTAWFTMASTLTQDDYENSLALQEDCV